MSKRPQILLAEDEYRAVELVARHRGLSVSELVRDSLRRTCAEEDAMDPSERIAAILRFANFSGPSADIEEIHADIERGRGLS